jgi:hypothetical protein
MKQKYIRFLIIINFLTIHYLLSSIHCLYADKGTTAGQFLNLPLGARAMAMGGAYTGLADEVNTLYWNPAGMVQIHDKEITLMRAAWFEGISHNYLAYSNGSIGLGVNMLSSGDIGEFDNLGNNLNQTYTSTDLNVALGYAKQFGGTSIGISVKDVQSKIENESASSVCADIGMFFDYWKTFKFGIVTQNLGGSLKFVNESFPITMNTKAGFSYAPGTFIFSADVVSSSDQGVYECAGVEYPFGILAIRGGYTTAVSGFDTLSGVNAGFGLKFKSFLVDYAWGAYGELGATNMVSLAFKFSGTAQGSPKVLAGSDAEKTPQPKSHDVQTEASVKAIPEKQNAEKTKTEPIRSFDIGVIDFKPLPPLSADDSASTTEIFRALLVQAKKFTVVDRDIMDNALSEQGFREDGCASTECAVKIGRVLNVNKMIVGTLGKSGEHYLLTISVMDVEKGETIYTGRATCKQLSLDDVELAAYNLVSGLIKAVR